MALGLSTPVVLFAITIISMKISGILVRADAFPLSTGPNESENDCLDTLSISRFLKFYGSEDVDKSVKCFAHCDRGRLRQKCWHKDGIIYRSFTGPSLTTEQCRSLGEYNNESCQCRAEGQRNHFDCQTVRTRRGLQVQCSFTSNPDKVVDLPDMSPCSYRQRRKRGQKPLSYSFFHGQRVNFRMPRRLQPIRQCVCVNGVWRKCKNGWCNSMQRWQLDLQEEQECLRVTTRAC